MSPRNTSVRRGGAREGARKRAFYDESFKLMVVESALQRPHNNRIKPTCACYPGIEPCQLRKWIRNLEAVARERMAGQATSQAPLSTKRAAPAASRESAPAAKRVHAFVVKTAGPPPAAAPVRLPHMLTPLHELGISLVSRLSFDTPDLMCESSRSSSACTSPSASPSDSPRHIFDCDPRLMTHASVPVVDLAAGTRASAVALPAARPLAAVADNVRLTVPLLVVKPFAVLGQAVYGQAGASYATCWQPQQHNAAAAAGSFEGAGHDKELSADLIVIDSLLADGLGEELGEELFANETDDADSPGWVDDWLSELMGGN